MDYTELTADDQYRMLQSRLKQYEQHHLDATMNLGAAEATGKTREAEQFTAQIAELELVAGLVRARLAGMTPPEQPVAARPDRFAAQRLPDR